MTSQCGPRRPNLNETKMRRRYDVACRVGGYLNFQVFLYQNRVTTRKYFSIINFNGDFGDPKNEA